MIKLRIVRWGGYARLSSLLSINEIIVSLEKKSRGNLQTKEEKTVIMEAEIGI